MHKSIKETLGYDTSITEKEIVKDWNERMFSICKPCWELEYCPYGPLVEKLPLLPPTRKEAEEHNNYLKKCLQTGTLGNGANIDPKRKKRFQKKVASFKPGDYPKSVPLILKEASCRLFGHVCPVFFYAEPFTETRKRRSHSRSIPRDVMLKVVRRDGQICQKCNKPVADNEVEFDHLIPFSKGGRSTTNNLSLVHKNCNRQKSNSLKDILHPTPIKHLFKLREKNKPKSKS